MLDYGQRSVSMTHLAFVNPLLFRPGDRLTLEEFLDRWEKMPDLMSAELIDGQVYMASPVSAEHSFRGAPLESLLWLYTVRTGIAQVFPNATWLILGKCSATGPGSTASAWVRRQDRRFRSACERCAGVGR